MTVVVRRSAVLVLAWLALGATPGRAQMVLEGHVMDDSTGPLQIFLDGVRATGPTPGADVTVDDLAQPQGVEAIEYSVGFSSTPPAFLTPEARCGVIAI